MEIITTHINADFDALGSMIAAKKLYPDAVPAFPGGQEKTIRNFLLSSAMYALDFEKGGEVARNLYALYNFLTRHILEADLKKDINALAEVIAMTAELKSAWEGILNGNSTKDITSGLRSSADMGKESTTAREMRA